MILEKSKRKYEGILNKTIICPYCDYEFSAEDSKSLFNDFCNQNQPYQAKIFCEYEWQSYQTTKA